MAEPILVRMGPKHYLARLTERFTFGVVLANS